MFKPFFIVGPTATGKSALAVTVATRYEAEIVNADAIQVYTGFPLLTAKPEPKFLRQVPHHLVGVVPCTEEYSVARYLTAAQSAIADIQARGKLAIVVGGAGLYVKALTHGLSPLPAAHPTLRAELSALDILTLQARLECLDPAAASLVDLKNKRRLIRAIEVCECTGTPFSDQRVLWHQESGQRPTLNGVCLTRPKDELHARIDLRIDMMFQAGVLDEVRLAKSDLLSSTASRMIGYRDIVDYLAGTLSLAECQQRIRTATRQYAKRQVTWFKREESFAPFPLLGEDATSKMEAALCRAVSEHLKGAT